MDKKIGKKLIFKMGMATLLMVLFLKTNTIDWSILSSIFNINLSTLIALCFIILNFMILNQRWKNLLEVQSGYKISFWEVLLSNWIGSFFSMALPGAYGGDLIKIFYISSRYTVSKFFLIATIIVDRLFGLMALFVIVGVPSLIYHRYFIEKYPDLKYIIQINTILFFLTVITLTCTSIIVLNKKWFIRKIKIIPQEYLDLFKIKLIIYNLLISIIGQYLFLSAFWTIIKSYLRYSLSFFDFVAIIPMAFLSIVIPITPQGIGVGHYCFEWIFRLLGQSNGASFFNVFLVLNLFINFMGFIPFLIKKSNIPSLFEVSSNGNKN